MNQTLDILNKKDDISNIKNTIKNYNQRIDSLIDNHEVHSNEVNKSILTNKYELIDVIKGSNTGIESYV